MLRRVPLAACISLAATMTVVAYEPVAAQSQPGTRVDGPSRVATAPPQADINGASRTEAMAPAETAPSDTVPSETMAPVPPETPSVTPPVIPGEPPAQTTSPAPAETATPAPRVVEVDPLVAQVRQQLAIAKIGDATSAERAALKAFYAERNAPVWVTPEGFTDRARHAMAEIAKADEWGLQASAFTLPTLPSSDRSPAALADAEIKLSFAVLEYARHARGGRLDPSQVSRNFDQKVTLRDPKVVLETVAGLETPGSYLRALHPQHPQFELLRQALLKARAGSGRPEVKTDVVVMIPDGPALKLGMDHADVSLVRERLRLPLPPGAEDVYDEQVQAAVAEFQRKNGIRPDGVLGSRTRAALNGNEKAPPAFGSDEQRLIVNMERWRWMPEELGRFYVWDNVPEFTTRVVKNGRLVHQAKIIVGKPDTQTVMFSANMRYVVFGPEWGVPDSIKIKEILPYLRPGGYGVFGGFGGTDTRVLERHNLRVSYNGRPVDASQVDWSQVDIRRFTFIQPPGAANVLGAVKFRFPNRHDIYMHDTPQRELFEKPVRAFSHGCMRVQNPGKLAEILLGEDKGWSAEHVRDLMARGGNNEITLSTQIPVHVTYFTAVAGEDGHVKFQADLYGHDRRLIAALAGKPLPLEPAPNANDGLREASQKRGKGYQQTSNDFFQGLFGN